MLRLRGVVLRVGAAGLDALLHLILLHPRWVLGFQMLACWEGVRTGALGHYTHRHKLCLLLHLPHFHVLTREKDPDSWIVPHPRTRILNTRL